MYLGDPGFPPRAAEEEASIIIGYGMAGQERLASKS
jgi:hypothetical protein